MLNDILGDSVGHDEFQEELENTEASTIEGKLNCLAFNIFLAYHQ